MIESTAKLDLPLLFVGILHEPVCIGVDSIGVPDDGIGVLLRSLRLGLDSL